MDGAPLWAGVLFATGLADSHSDRPLRLRARVLPRGLVLGGHEDEGASVSLVPRLLLIGVTISVRADGASIVRGHPALSRDVILRPGGEADERAALHGALVASAAFSGSVTWGSGSPLWHIGGNGNNEFSAITALQAGAEQAVWSAQDIATHYVRALGNLQ